MNLPIALFTTALPAGGAEWRLLFSSHDRDLCCSSHSFSWIYRHWCTKTVSMRTRELVGFTFALVVSLCLQSRAADHRPSVLFYGYAPHADYVAKPLQAMGVEVGTCAKGELAQAIANDNYHVLVVATMNDADRQAADSFLARGGGVLVCNPNWSSVEGDFEKTCQWLTSKGARPRWEMLKDSSPSNIVQVTFGCP
jgi:hypothetical protein